MTTDLVLVDGPNLFNAVARHLDKCSRELSLRPAAGDSLKDYFATWFDYDRLASATLRASVGKAGMGMVIFHSQKPLGGRACRLEGSDLNNFWGRQGSNPNSSTFAVLVPGEQTERFPFDCKHCGEHNDVESTSEKGVDASMIVYMFESMERWDSLCIFSRDVDFVPAIWSLRRIGKRVFAAGDPSGAESALGRAAQDFFPVPLGWCEADYEAFRFLRPGGLVDRVLLKAQAEQGRRRVMRGSQYLDIWATSAAFPALQNAAHSEGITAINRIENGSHVGIRLRLDAPERPILRLKPAWEAAVMSTLSPEQFSD